MRLSGKEAPEMTRARKVQDPREQQKDAATKGLHNIESTIGLMADLNSEARDLLNHVQGFYLEVDKLAKGKAMLEVTQRILDETNLIISDAKRLAKNDPFLSRTKEFVTAGNNPVYPDVVVTIRTVQQSLDRLLERIAQSSEANLEIQSELRTIIAALELEDEGEETITEEDLHRRLKHAPSERWVIQFSFNDKQFDFDRLDRVGPPVVPEPPKIQLALGSGE
jgi:hypothetical protein